MLPKLDILIIRCSFAFINDEKNLLLYFLVLAVSIIKSPLNADDEYTCHEMKA